MQKDSTNTKKIIRGTFLWSPEPDVMKQLEQGYALLENGFLKSLTEQLPSGCEDVPVTDYEDALIIPAFTDLHLHASQYPNCGIGLDKALLPWLQSYTFPMEARYSDAAFAEYYYKKILNCLWSVGTMHFCAFATVHMESTWRFMQLTREAGFQAYIGKVNMDRSCPDFLREDTDTSLQETEELICRAASSLPGVKYILTPRFVPAATSRLMEGLATLAERYDLPVQSHLCENTDEIALVQKLHPDIPNYTQVYDTFGLLRPGKTILAHGVHLAGEEADLLAGKDILLAHCAQSNTNLSSGIMPLRKHLQNGIRCGIASDIGAGHTPAMYRQIASTIQTSKIHGFLHPEDTPLSLTEVFYLATKENGSFFGNTGSFEPEYSFDALVIPNREPDSPLQRTPYERLEQFLYNGDDRFILARYLQGEKMGQPFPG